MTWTTITLSDLATVSSGGGAPQDANAFSSEGMPFIRAGSLIKLLEGLPEDGLELLQPEVASAHKLKLFPAGTVLFAKSGMSATKGHIYQLKKPAYVVNHLAALTPRSKSAGDYLRHVLRFKSPTCLIKDEAYPSIRLGEIENMEVPAPKADSERERIAAILDKADELRRKRQRALDRLNQLGQSIFHEMFGDLTTNQRAWPPAGMLSDYAEIASGITKGRKINGGATRSIPYLAVVNVQDKRLQLDPLKEIKATDAEIKRYRLQRNDLLLTEGGDPDKLGRGTLWNEELPECIHQNHIFRVRLISDKINPVYLNWLVGSQYGKAYFLKSAKQTTGIASINSTQLKAFPMLVPPLETQEAFSARLKGINAFQKGLLNGKREHEHLFAALQHRAFRGEL